MQRRKPTERLQGHTGLALVPAYGELEAALREDSYVDESRRPRNSRASVMALLRSAADDGRVEPRDAALLADYWVCETGSHMG